jgi:hypothetical protein
MQLNDERSVEDPPGERRNEPIWETPVGVDDVAALAATGFDQRQQAQDSIWTNHHIGRSPKTTIGLQRFSIADQSQALRRRVRDAMDDDTWVGNGKIVRRWAIVGHDDFDVMSQSGYV